MADERMTVPDVKIQLFAANTANDSCAVAATVLWWIATQGTHPHTSTRTSCSQLCSLHKWCSRLSNLRTAKCKMLGTLPSVCALTQPHVITCLLLTNAQGAREKVSIDT